jgi:putative transposase
VILFPDSRGFPTPAEYRHMHRLRHIVIPDYPYMVTTVTAARFPFFTDPADAQIVLDAILQGHYLGWWKVIAFVVMPDHLHIIMVPAKKNISECVKAIKGYSARLTNARLQRRGSLWQPGFFDYILDSEDKILSRVAYIENNPVRSGFVAHPEEYSFSSASWVEKMDRVF